MSRIRQQYPQDYGTSGKIHTEFENIYRYLGSAELGNKTLYELISTLFDENGEFDGPIEFRVNPTTGLEYRIGEYTNQDDGWILLSSIADIRGPEGIDYGQIEGPIFFNRSDIVTSTTTTTLTYAFQDSVADILVYKNGLLLPKTDYTANSSTSTITLATSASSGTKFTIYSIRSSIISNYRRSDYTVPSAMAVIPFPHTDDEKILVYRNGLLQREGSSYDYVRSATSGTITFITPLSSGEKTSVFTVENLSTATVAGLMTEEKYTDANGFITYSKLSIADDQIPQGKVSNLTTDLESRVKIFVSATTPTGAVTSNLWMDTSQTPNILKFYDGIQWLNTSPSQSIPGFTNSNATQYMRVNGTGTALEYGDIDFSSLVPKTYMGAANGVASLDSSGKLPTGQLPDIYSVDSFSFINVFEDTTTAVTNKTYYVKSIFRQKVRIDGISYVMGSGTCTIQLAVDGIAVGTTYAVSTTRVNTTISPVIEIDGATNGRRIGIIVTSAASTPTLLDVVLSVATLSA